MATKSVTKKKVEAPDGLTEIRWHGRGGQGAVTAAKMVAELALGQHKYFQAFPEYGPERSGAPMVRVADGTCSPGRCSARLVRLPDIHPGRDVAGQDARGPNGDR